MSTAMIETAAKRLGLSKYRLSGKVDGNDQYSIELSAKTSSSAWSKFITLYFGTLKPLRRDWKIQKLK